MVSSARSVPTHNEESPCTDNQKAEVSRLRSERDERRGPLAREPQLHRELEEHTPSVLVLNRAWGHGGWQDVAAAVHAKLVKDFQVLLKEFQAAQQICLDREAMYTPHASATTAHKPSPSVSHRAPSFYHPTHPPLPSLNGERRQDDKQSRGAVWAVEMGDVTGECSGSSIIIAVCTAYTHAMTTVPSTNPLVNGRQRQSRSTERQRQQAGEIRT
jgi:hypothetical protein